MIVQQTKTAIAAKKLTLQSSVLTERVVSIMSAVKNTESLANCSNEISFRSVFHCPEFPEFIWDLNHTTSFKIIDAITSIACPVTILLNLLVIIAVKTRRELRQNSNILLSSVALADLLVGAVSMPLSVTLDTLVINRALDVDIICTMAFVNASVMYFTCGASFLHLLLIAWERHVAIAKWMEYKAIVTTGRVNKYTRVAWLLAVPVVGLSLLMEAARLRYERISVGDVILSIFWVVCFLLVVFFYVKTYLFLRKWNGTRIRPVNGLVKGKLESKVAYTTFWLTVFVVASGVPIQVVYLFREVWPFFGQVSTLRWAETIFQLNSLFNPLLYWYRNRRKRKAALELLRCRKRPTGHTARYVRPRGYSGASLDVEKLQNEQTGAPFVRSESLGAVMCLNTFRQTSSKAVKERPMSAPSRIASDEMLTLQDNELIATVQIKNASGRKGIQSKSNGKHHGAWKICASYGW